MRMAFELTQQMIRFDEDDDMCKDRIMQAKIRSRDSGESTNTTNNNGNNSNFTNNDNDETEIEKLRYRISQLEHLIVAPPSSTTSNTNTFNYASISLIPPPEFFSSSTKANTLHHNPTELSAIAPNYETTTLLYRISQLESLLAGSEIDNRNLNEKLELLNVAKNRQQMELLEEMKCKELEIIEHEQTIKLLKLQNSSSAKRLSAVEEYINTLPSQEELDELKSQVDKLSLEKDYLNDRLKQVKLELNSTQKELINKEHVLQNALVRLEELKPYEEAQESLMNETSEILELTTSDSSSPQVSHEKILKFATVQKAQVIQSAKIVKALRTRLESREAERKELTMKLADKVKFTNELQEELISLQFENESVHEKWRKCMELKNSLEKQCCALKSKIESLETLSQSRKDAMTKLIHLSTQLELCFNELQQLIQLCQTICNGEEPSMEHLLGFINEVDELDAHVPPINQDELDDDDSQGLNVELILQKLIGICEQRKGLQVIRTKINNLYTDTIAQDLASCNVQ